MRTFTLASLFLALPLAGGNLQVSNGTQNWVDSGINLEMVQQQISNEKCASSAEYLEACRRAVGAVGREIDLAKFDLSDEDDFDGVLQNVDQIQNSEKPKEWLFGLMINSFLRGFDAHAILLPKKEFESLLGPATDVHYGIGAHLMATDSGVFIRSLVHASPAVKAGLRPFDKVIQIAGKDLGTGVEAQRSFEQFKYQPGKSVDFLVDREGRRRHVSIKVGVVTEQNVSAEIYSVNRRRYLYVNLDKFKEESCVKLQEKIAKVKIPYKGIILDLRDNPGGILDQGVCVAGLFVGQKNIVGQKSVPVQIPLDVGETPSPFDEISWQAGPREAQFNKVPLIVLINSESASAAEIVAAALQDHGAAWVVGERSFGKGSVQNVQSFKGPTEFYLAYTAALFYRPDGSTNQLVGVTPNFEVPLRRQFKEEDRHSPREEDLYENSLRPLEFEIHEWQETRPVALTFRQCVERSGVLEKTSTYILRRQGYEDFQTAYALALLSCSEKISSQHNP